MWREFTLARRMRRMSTTSEALMGRCAAWWISNFACDFIGDCSLLAVMCTVRTNECEGFLQG